MSSKHLRTQRPDITATKSTASGHYPQDESIAVITSYAAAEFELVMLNTLQVAIEDISPRSIAT